MVVCSFCAEDIEPGTGKMLIQKDGRIHNFCSSKCEKNQIKLKRVGRTQKWTKAFRVARDLVKKK